MGVHSRDLKFRTDLNRNYGTVIPPQVSRDLKRKKGHAHAAGHDEEDGEKRPKVQTELFFRRKVPRRFTGARVGIVLLARSVVLKLFLNHIV